MIIEYRTWHRSRSVRYNCDALQCALQCVEKGRDRRRKGKKDVLTKFPLLPSDESARRTNFCARMTVVPRCFGLLCARTIDTREVLQRVRERPSTYKLTRFRLSLSPPLFFTSFVPLQRTLRSRMNSILSFSKNYPPQPNAYPRSNHNLNVVIRVCLG